MILCSSDSEEDRRLSEAAVSGDTILSKSAIPVPDSQKCVRTQSQNDQENVVAVKRKKKKRKRKHVPEDQSTRPGESCDSESSSSRKKAKILEKNGR